MQELLFFPIKNKNAKISSSYGSRKNPFTGLIQNHKGIDIAVSTGTEIFSPLPGLVTKTAYSDSLGNHIWITSGDYKFLFGHLSKILVKTGDTVTKDRIIGLSGSSGKVTGSHIHFAVYYKNNPIDPLSKTEPQKNQFNIFYLFIPILLYTILKQK